MSRQVSCSRAHRVTGYCRLRCCSEAPAIGGRPGPASGSLRGRLRRAPVPTCSTHTTSPDVFGKSTACCSLDQDEVLALGARRYAERELATRARQEREQQKPAPPDDEHEWLTASQAARVVGMSV